MNRLPRQVLAAATRSRPRAARTAQALLTRCNSSTSGGSSNGSSDKDLSIEDRQRAVADLLEKAKRVYGSRPPAEREQVEAEGKAYDTTQPPRRRDEEEPALYGPTEAKAKLHSLVLTDPLFDDPLRDVLADLAFDAAFAHRKASMEANGMPVNVDILRTHLLTDGFSEVRAMARQVKAGKLDPALGVKAADKLSDPATPLGNPEEELMTKLETPAVQRKLQHLDQKAKRKLHDILTRVPTLGGANVEALREASAFLHEIGVRFEYSTRPAQTPIGEESVSFDKVDIDWTTEKEIILRQREKELAERAARRAKEEAEYDPTRTITVKDEMGHTFVQQYGVEPYPDLMTADPIMDSRTELDFPPTEQTPYHNKVVFRNHESIFHEAMEDQGFDFADPDWVPEKSDEVQETQRESRTLPKSLKWNLHRYALVSRFVSHQTGKGKIARYNMMTVIGNGDGIVGFGQGTHEESSKALKMAELQAIKNLDYVDRFEKRTIWSDLETKLGATRVKMRPRPLGFGLMCNPNVHQVLKAAGIKDISAKVWGSRNKIQVIKATLRMIQSGHAPIGMGDGIGGKGLTGMKGMGLISKQDVERERGRKLIHLQKS